MEVEKDVCAAGKECRGPVWTCLGAVERGRPVGGLWGAQLVRTALAALPTWPTLFGRLGS